MSAIIKDLNDAGVVIPTTSPSTFCLTRADGSWRMTVDYYELNQVVTPVAAVVLDVVGFIA